MPHEGNETLALALAALAVAEAVFVLLIEKGVISEADLNETLTAAVESHANAEPSLYSAEDHLAAATVIERLMRGANAVRASARL